MNKLITTQNGGFPLDLDDIRWLDDGLRESLEGLTKPWTNYYILSGVTVTESGGNKECTEGFAVIDGEICYVPAQTVAIPSPLADHDWVIQLKQTFDTDGNETFQNGSSYDTYAIRQGELAYADISKPPSGTKTKHTEYLPAEDYKTLKGLITASVYADIITNAEEWTEFTLAGSWAKYASASGPTPRYRKELGRVVTEGQVQLASPTGVDVIATLPAGYRPVNDIVVFNAARYANETMRSTLVIKTNGQIELAGPSTSGQANVSLDTIPPFIPA